MLTCSALKRSYRDRLRTASPGLRFVFLEISPADAKARVSARAAKHFFSTRLVGSQFETLEPPTGEQGVLTVYAQRPVKETARRIQRWLHP